MIQSVRNKITKESHTAAACDRCKAVCEASKVPGWRGMGLRKTAMTLAKANGWVERTADKPDPGRRKLMWTIELLCPKCAAESGPEARP